MGIGVVTNLCELGIYLCRLEEYIPVLVLCHVGVGLLTTLWVIAWGEGFWKLELVFLIYGARLEAFISLRKTFFGPVDQYIRPNK